MQPFESIIQLDLPPQAQARLRDLLGNESNGTLNARERYELDLLLEAQATLAALRARATTPRSESQPASSPERTMRNGLQVMLVPAGTADIDPVAARRFLEEEAF